MMFLIAALNYLQQFC